MSSGSLKACLHPDQERKEGRDAVVRNVGRQLPERCHHELSPHRKFLVQLLGSDLRAIIRSRENVIIVV